jgi:hypothetical protein
MRLLKLPLLALALLASVSVTMSYTPAANVNRKAKPKRPGSAAIGAGGAGTYARRPQRKAPTAAPTPNAPNGNASFIGGSTDGVGIRRRGNQNGVGVQPHDPVNANANANQSFIGGSDDGVGIRRKAPRKRRRQ